MPAADRVLVAETPHETIAVGARHGDVADHRVPATAAQRRQRARHRPALHDLAAFAAQDQPQRLQHRGLVVQDQDPQPAHRAHIAR